MKKNEDKYKEWHEDPSNWILGLYYYNKKDKRLFPPKRIKQLGWTINFAHPASIITFIVLVALVILLSKLL